MHASTCPYALSLAYEKAYSFAVQLLRSGTSIGANIAEANGAISKADFSNKISVAYKECLETKYWLSLLKDTDFIGTKTFDSIHEEADESQQFSIQ